MSTEEVLKALERYAEEAGESGRQTATKVGVNRKRPVNPILKLGKRMPEVGAWKKRQLEECGYDVVGKR